MTDDYSVLVSSGSRIVKGGDESDPKNDNEVNASAVAPEEPNVPHYIVNLNMYNTSTDLDALNTLPIHTSVPGVSESSAALQTPDMNSSINVDNNVAMMCGINSTGRSHQFFMPAMRSKARGRGRFSSVPLDDVMEKKIRTYEGKDCVQELAKLLKLFPRFKRAPKAESKRSTDSKTPTRPELPLQSQAFLCMGLPLGRCPPHVANSLYRRVIVTPEGTVESADEHEQKFLNSTGLSSSVLESPSLHCEPPRPRPSLFSGLKLSPLSTVLPPIHQLAQFKRFPPSSSEEQALTSDNVEPPNPEETTPQQPGNKFFRTDHVGEAQKRNVDT
ncbi:unnamed protein product [Heterobilharzia americana]|nr:unnamed protein product [Heterobilharzia americana]